MLATECLPKPAVRRDHRVIASRPVIGSGAGDGGPSRARDGSLRGQRCGHGLQQGGNSDLRLTWSRACSKPVCANRFGVPMGEGAVSRSISGVAALAGVSRTTVSHVLSGNRPVGKETAERVRQAMTALGYVPSRSAQSLSLGVTHSLGLLVPDIGNGFFAEVAKGAEQAAIERGYNVLLCNTGWDFERELFYLETLKSRAVDGIVYAAGAPTKNSELAGLLPGLPVVAVDEELGDVAASTVVSDNSAGGRIAAGHLAGLGHRRALVVGVNPRLASALQRAEGFSAAWKRRRGAQVRVVSGSFEEASGFEAVHDHLDELVTGAVTAVFAVNDAVAFGALHALREAGIDVPWDCSLVGFDDTYAAQHLTPGLTTVRQDAVGLGRAAAQTVLDALGGAQVPERQIFEVSLVVRGTTGPVRKPRGGRSATSVLPGVGASLGQSPERAPARPLGGVPRERRDAKPAVALTRVMERA